MPSSRRRPPVQDESSDSDEGTALPTTMELSEREIYQAQIMMADLSSDTRAQITSTDKGPNNRPVNQRAVQQLRECNQEGTEAAEQLMRDHQAVNTWSTFHTTDNARTANEELPELDGGNSYRIGVRRTLEENKAQLGGELTVEDTYNERQFSRGIPPPMRNHAGSSAAYNDRGGSARGRGGGFAGRAGGRGASNGGSAPSNRPLDPAVDPDGAYVYKESKRKRGPKAQINNGRVTLQPDAQTQRLRKRTQLSAPRQQRPPLPPHVAMLSTDSQDFMARVLSKKPQVVAKVSQNKPAAPQATQATQAATGPVQPSTSRTVQSTQVANTKSSSASIIHQIDRNELSPRIRRSSTYTDGNLTSTSLSGFSPSLNGEAFTPVVNASEALGLGIRGVKASINATVSAEKDLLDDDIPDARNTSLSPSLTASPREQMVSVTKSDAELIQDLNALFSGPWSQEAFLALMEKQRSRKLPATTEDTTSAAKSKTPSTTGSVTKPTSTAKEAAREAAKLEPIKEESQVKVVQGYKLGSIFGDRNAFEKATKKTQTTPSLAQSRWANQDAALHHARASPAQVLGTSSSKTKDELKASPSLEELTETFEKTHLDARDNTPVIVSFPPAVPTHETPSIKAATPGITEAPPARNIKKPVSRVPRSEGTNPFQARDTENLSAAEPTTVTFKLPPKVNPALGNKTNVFTAAEARSSTVIKTNITNPVAESKWAAAPPAGKSAIASEVKLPISVSKDSGSQQAQKSVGASKWANTSPVRGPPLGDMPVNRVKSQISSILGDNSQVRRSDKRESSPAERPSVDAPGASIFGDSRNIRSATSSINLIGRPTKAGPPGLSWIREEQKSQRF